MSLPSPVLEGRAIQEERILACSVQQAWSYFTRPELLASWLGEGSIDPRPGGRVDLWVRAGDATSRKVHVTGSVTRCEPPWVLEMGWDEDQEAAGRVRFELASARDGTRVTMVHYPPNSGRSLLTAAALAGLLAVLADRVVPSAAVESNVASASGISQDGTVSGAGAAPAHRSARIARTGRRRAAVVVVVVALVVLVLLAMNFAGIINLPILPRGPNGSPSHAETALTFDQAQNLANQTASARGGSWQAVMGKSFSTSQAYNPDTSVPCDTSAFSPSSSSVLGTGKAYVWGFDYVSTPYTPPLSGKQLFIVVTNGTGTVTTQLDYPPSCNGIDTPFLTPLPSNLSNSPAVVARLQSLGSAGFLAEFPSAGLSLEATSEYGSGPDGTTPIWGAAYVSGCSGVAGNESFFEGTFYGPTLSVLNYGWSNQSCSTAIPPSYPVSFTSGTSGHSANGGLFFDNLTVSAPYGLTTRYLELAILQPNKTMVDVAYAPDSCTNPPFSGCGGPPGGWGSWYAILTASGAILATYPYPNWAVGWDSGTNGPVEITGTTTLELISTVPLAGSDDGLLAFTWDPALASVAGSGTL